jgi:hypothetical protein
MYDVWPPDTMYAEPSPFAHSKIYLRCLPSGFVEAQGNNNYKVPAIWGWLYVGSHNLSKNAWGSSAKKMGSPLVCHSLELGVVIPIKDEATLEQWKHWLPFNVNAAKYDANDTPYSSDMWTARRRAESFDKMVMKLVCAGYDPDLAEAAIYASNGNYNKALDMLLNPLPELTIKSTD